MKEQRIIMGMPVVIEIVDSSASTEIFEEIFSYLISVDERFSTYKKDSEITLYNEGKIAEENLSDEMKKVFRLSEETKKITGNYFDISYQGKIDPSGLVKGWAIYNSALILRKKGFKNFYVEIAGDIEVAGLNKEGKKWAIGIRNPFNKKENVKVVYLSDRGIATSGLYERGEHIYNPKEKKSVTEIASLTVIGKNIYEADRFATACFAMGKKGIYFLEKMPGLEGYMIDNDKIATFTTGFEEYAI
ncbi:MAG: FAD:protein FMN transferase [Candidatus Nomurabacteria bacterium]|nr:FAD:protein FMN transferase [Candidatus Nomurabacteria bacterium]